tara:strand:- start:3466 stop:3876 length:411 start_codon:yes stop_codon:yes gene_type:complete
MATQTVTNRQLVELMQGLNECSELRGVKFAMVVAKNIENIQKELKHIEEASKPTDEFRKVAEEVQKLHKDGNESAAKKLEGEHKDLEQARQEQLKEVEKLLEEEATIQLYTIYSDKLPFDISAKQIMSIRKIVIDN